jgi:glycosyltransferase involved in cell wall biosynthesis
LTALPAIRERYPDASVYVAGDDLVSGKSLKQRLKMTAYGRYCKSLIRKNRLEGSVVFLGRLNAEQMRERYLKSNLFVCCSSVENSPNSLGEAMLLGMPCVSADVGGIPSIFTDGEDGILYEGYRHGQEIYNNNRNEKTDAEDQLEVISRRLADAVLRIWGDSRRQREYCQNAREHAKKNHDRESNYRKMKEIYAKMMRTGED